ncbi:3-oxoacyl-[acyl-carrier protein] reductase [Capronia epimyces CBS 606.96]|uniref:3-oxoacyl-[acyl-carrier protein] reductase n=1 Tax=Capronia epimyces CBS 606.96 TaxID=1182542 RepID=W9Y446_9EURO|nr:3-oxoacyl-[acyl-carrier protein] reductase [Capronia epimyces CBS 606.96]EXJ83981.1 3-oxoacyl-[acyl-carrier protein] reductase [Capronia epimyces CBS 606.96]
MAPPTLFPGVAVITGAGGVDSVAEQDIGIGAHVALAFAAEGCSRIAITDLSTTLLQQTVESIQATRPGVEVFSEPGDITDADFVGTFMKRVVEKFHRIDYAVNCAGILGKDQRSDEMDLASFDAINSVNYRGCWLSSRAELQAMLKQEPLPGLSASRPAQRGAIVNIASQLGIVSRPKAPAYCASKSAVIGMTRADAIDYSTDNIRINCVCPGVIKTAMTTGTEEVAERLAPAVRIAPMQRMGLPEEVADAVLFLCSPKASFVQGHALVVDGGYIIN